MVMLDKQENNQNEKMIMIINNQKREKRRNSTIGLHNVERATKNTSGSLTGPLNYPKLHLFISSVWSEQLQGFI